MLFLFQMHQDDGGGTLYVEDYSKVKIDDDDDDNDDDDAVSWHIVWQTWRLRDKKTTRTIIFFIIKFFLFSTVLFTIELRGKWTCYTCQGLELTSVKTLFIAMVL